MAGYSRSKNGVASLAYVPAIHAFAHCKEDVDARIRGHDGKGENRRGSATPARVIIREPIPT
jgi:hypothetical protein